MALKPGLQTRLGQRLALTPDMRSALEILRLPSDILSDLIAAEADENPYLICEAIRHPTGAASAFDVAVLTTPARPHLHDSLITQLAQMRLAPEIRRAAHLLMVELRDDGYLDATLEELSAEFSLPVAELGAGLEALQQCDPPGIGARDLPECLTLQLRDRGLSPELASAVVRHLADFADGRWTRLVADLGLPISRLHEISDLLRGLVSAPVQPENTPLVTRIPDLMVWRGGDGMLEVALNPDALPRLSLLEGLGEARTTDTGLHAKHARARSLVRALRARTQTLLRIGRAITALQPGFFLGDHAKLIPVSRAELAGHLDLHPTTIGRAVAGKSLLSGGTIFPLETFFSAPIATHDGVVSAFSVQRRIAALVQAENGEAPLSDDDIRQSLGNEGVDIARRTVAKYRKCMRIPSSYERRRRKVSRKNRPVFASSSKN